jgi:hypothetical protein
MEQLDERLCQEILGRLCALAGVTPYIGDLAYQTLSYWVGQEIRPICTRFVNEALGVKEICTPAEPRPWSPPELLSELPADRTVDTDVPARPDGGLPLRPWEKAPEPWDAQVWGSPHVCAACGTGYVVSLQEDTQCPNCAIQRGLNRSRGTVSNTARP